METLQKKPAGKKKRHIDISCGLTPREFARLFRMSHDRAPAMILRGELQAVNMAVTRCGKPRFLIMPDHVAEFQRVRQAVTAPPKVQRRKRQAGTMDYYPD